MREQTFARAAAGPRPRASELLRPFIPPRSPSGRRLARHPSSNDPGVAESRDSSFVEPWLPRSPACLLVLHCSRPSRPLKPPNCLGGWRCNSPPKMPHSHLAHEARGPFEHGSWGGYRASLILLHGASNFMKRSLEIAARAGKCDLCFLLETGRDRVTFSCSISSAA